MKTNSPDRRRTRSFRPTAETLEGRVVLSWAATPPPHVTLGAAGNDQFNVSSFDRNGGYTATNAITRSEIDYRTFVAQRSGTYTFEAKANGSKIDTVEALFDQNGNRLAFNDDAPGGGTKDSKFSVSLNAGQKYVLGVTNYTNSAQGAYRVTITSPVLYNSASTSVGAIYSSGNATLNGTTLSLYLYGQTRKAFYYTDHYIQVQILDRAGLPIHTGAWTRGFRTAGQFVPGSPEVNFQTWSIDVSGFDLSRASRLSVVVGY